jgi:multimeric flavodoxin WrbA
MGSLRKKGNCRVLCSHAEKGVRGAGGIPRRFVLHEMSIAPCSACDTCQESMDRYCVNEDDMQRLYPEIAAADALLIASPVYWFTVSAQTKLFMDRCYALLGPGESANNHGLLQKARELGYALAGGTPAR